MSKNVLSYVTYSSVAVTNGVISSAAPDPLTNTELKVGASEMEQVQNLPWFFEYFPEAVESGSLVMDDGSVFVNGMALTEVIPLTIALITVFILFVKSVGDLKTFINNTKLNEMNRELADEKKEIQRLERDKIEEERLIQSLEREKLELQLAQLREQVAEAQDVPGEETQAEENK